MRAAVLRRPGRLLVTGDWPDPHPRGDQRLVRVRAAGLCGSDLHMVDGKIAGPLPRVLGHEIAGHVDGLGDVLVYPCWSDGSCEFCRRGLEQLCPASAEPGWAVDGGFAERLLVPHPKFLLPLEGLDPIHAAPLADAGVTAYRAVTRARPWLMPGATALVIGVGGLGQFAIQFLRLLTGARVIAVDTTPAKRRMALALGAEEAVGADDRNGGGDEGFGGDNGAGDELPPAHVAFDFVGTSATIRQAVASIVPTGLVMLVGEAGGQVPFGFTNVPYEACLTTSVWGSRADLEAVLDHAWRGDLTWQVEPVPLDRANEALDRLREGTVAGRIVLVP